MATKCKLDADLRGTLIDQTRYRSMIGSLMYLASNRPDLVQAVCYCARYQARPTKKHLKEVDHVGCLDTLKSTYGGILFLGEKLVSWMSKKQDCTAMSSAELEYVALSAKSAQDRDVGLGGSLFRNFAKKKSMKKAFQDMLHGLGEVNPTHAYYNGSFTSKDNEDPSWSTSFKTRRTHKTSSALKDFICVVFVLDRNIVRNSVCPHIEERLCYP
ncbi:hypothetical protein Tco_1569629 [Tanacetum coccineum]